MNDIFGKICSIFLAVIILFGMPLVYMSERAKTAEQMELLTEATHFVDSRNSLLEFQFRPAELPSRFDVPCPLLGGQIRLQNDQIGRAHV